jgi:hypothetical protein
VSRRLSHHRNVNRPQAGELGFEAGTGAVSGGFEPCLAEETVLIESKHSGEGRHRIRV